jgi:hypothetical protein
MDTTERYVAWGRLADTDCGHAHRTLAAAEACAARRNAALRRQSRDAIRHWRVARIGDDGRLLDPETQQLCWPTYGRGCGAVRASRAQEVRS